MNKKLSKARLVSAILLASSQLALSQLANADWYGELSAVNSELNDAALNSSGRSTNTVFDDDTGFSFAIGYQYDNGFRLEGEYLSTENDAQTVTFNGNVFTGNNVTGGIDTSSLFVNAIQAFNHDGAFSPYIGAGIGYTDVQSDIGYGPVANITDDDSVFSYQLLAGLDVRFSEKLTGFAEYRYVDVGNVDLDRFGGGPGGVQTTTQSGDIDFDAYAIGLKYSF